MSANIESLQPNALWTNFANLNAVPRASKKEEKVIAFAKKFGESLGLKTFVDEVGNVIIKKPATPGMENRMTVALQSHLDMVHQKNADTNFDFETQGIQMLIDGDWVKAKGTTLGADNGIGVATIMALLQSTDIPHPPLEALFTIDEETGMTGAKGLKGDLLDAKIMLNLDTENDKELCIGCAGGIDVTAFGEYEEVLLPKTSIAYKVSIKGLTGGHSGMDIHLGRGNANKLMNRLLFEAGKDLDLFINAIDGGSLRNAIPRESFAVIAVEAEDTEKLLAVLEQWQQVFRKEYQTTDPELKLLVEKTDHVSKVLNPEFQELLIRSVYTCPNGIYRMSPDVDGLVQTSNNLARVHVENGRYRILCLTRSSVDSEKMDEAQAIESCFELMGADVIMDGSYPGWTPKPEAAIVKIMEALYQKMYEGEPEVSACHAGLECGILGTNYPEMEMISFGPNIHGAHSPDEKVQVSSVQKFWGFLLETLKHIPVQNN